MIKRKPEGSAHYIVVHVFGAIGEILRYLITAFVLKEPVNAMMMMMMMLLLMMIIC
jgi:hypothetical protein